MMRYEWKKIFERRLNVVAMVLGYVLIGICWYSFLSQESFYDVETGSYIEGPEAIRMDRERAARQTDVITEAYMTELIGEIQQYHQDLESNEAYIEIIRPLGDIFYFVSRNYTDMREKNTDIGALEEVDLTDGARFYEHRMEKIKSYLNCDFSYGNYTEAEKAYWIQKAENTDIPFRWGSRKVMDGLLGMTFAGLYLQLVIVICASSVFAHEYESGAAPLLLTTKYGKDGLIRCKIAVSLLFTVGYLSVAALLTVGATAIVVGLPGADLPVQLWNSVIPYNLTIGQTCLGAFAVNLLIGVTVTAVLLCCSARLRSSLATLVVGAALILAPAFFPMSRTSGLWNHINYLFPVRVFNLENMLGSYVSYAVGDVVIPYIGMVVIVYAVTGIAALLLTRRGLVKA
ncbi:MAG: ABC transporter permease subunit [Clostridium sp.]|nr:ABC transporter permease subunit [Acetatifactor muris]MCM1528024.1 ABC transporter permease subunit [Bacteroides sp.]MCM1563087.1 ABC transporter permease subunit [Clostridium sp.]